MPLKMEVTLFYNNVIYPKLRYVSQPRVTGSQDASFPQINMAKLFSAKVILAPKAKFKKAQTRVYRNQNNFI